MVKLNKIYTRTGDDGTTGLVDGSRRNKYDLRVEAYGDVDETNSIIGMARLHTSGEHDAILARVQNDLFDLGADLATPYSDAIPEDKALRVIAAQTTRLENEIDALNAHIAPLNSFILPGGGPAAAHLHLARTVCRRAERVACHLAAQEQVNPETIRFLNRLSDLLFVLGRAVNENGATDVLWVPGANR
jgi:cob(I)alamin adenosyltransferase